MKKCKGIWFYGFSGSGKSHISKILHKKIENSVVLDGDIIIIKPEKRSLIVAIAQGFTGTILFIVLSLFFNSLNYFVMFSLFM